MRDAHDIFLYFPRVCTYYMHLSTKNRRFTEGMAPQPSKNHKYNKMQFILVCVCVCVCPRYTYVPITVCGSSVNDCRTR